MWVRIKKVWILFKFGFLNKSKSLDLFRHAKAMHMTQAEIHPVFIRDFLGHADLKTTEIYSKTNVEMKRKALEKMDNAIVPDTMESWSKNEEFLWQPETAL